ncbi:MAG TPA: 4a-hydroxytetrahydrobiopterin dehydratase [Candidatus Dormibacteraeota bacterium]|nr:4a-hydroxytetrahydrobiopterin dehydratase [Candidatus Dormibacteraeota bacterium]
MDTPLAERKCVRCEPGTPALDRQATQDLAAQVPAWHVTSADGHPVLTRTFKFKGFMPGVDLVNRIAAIAEEEGHHPDLSLGWGYLTVQLWTHAAEGLTENDFIVAAKVDQAESTKS